LRNAVIFGRLKSKIIRRMALSAMEIVLRQEWRTAGPGKNKNGLAWETGASMPASNML